MAYRLGFLPLFVHQFIGLRLLHVSLHWLDKVLTTTVKQAGEASDVKIVTYDWLLASANNKLKADEGAFSIVQPVSSQNGRSTKGKKRAHSPTPVKTDSSDEDTDSKPPAKKSKDGQKAKTRALQIPVDEMCSLAGKDTTPSSHSIQGAQSHLYELAIWCYSIPNLSMRRIIPIDLSCTVWSCSIIC